MKKIGLYLSTGPHSGGSFQYCLTDVKNLKFLDKKKYRITAFITNKIWRNYLPKEFVVIEVKKNNKVDRYLNYLSFIIFLRQTIFLLPSLSYHQQLFDQVLDL